MELDFTLSADNPLWSIIGIIALLVGSYLTNKSSGNPLGASFSLDTVLKVLAGSRIPLLASFVVFIGANPAFREKLDAIWKAFLGGTPAPDQNNVPPPTGS